jgi:hypothetical protein
MKISGFLTTIGDPGKRTLVLQDLGNLTKFPGSQRHTKDTTRSLPTGARKSVKSNETTKK